MTTRRARGASAPTAGALLSVLLALTLGACGGGDAAGESIPGVRSGAVLAAPADRSTAPIEVAAPVLGDDATLALSALEGQVVVVNFWGSWCGPCRREQPELNTAAEVLADEPVAFVGVNVDDSEPNALAHEREFEVPYRSVFDPDASYAAQFGGLGAAAVPTTLLVDPEGRLALRLIGETDALEVVAAVERLLQEVPDATA